MKVHLLFKKEDIDLEQMNEDKLAVVFDVLLATSTITACLEAGAKQVIPVMDEAEGTMIAKKFKQEEVCLAGEHGGLPIEGFVNPTPLSLRKQVEGKTVVLSTTNGTIAIRNASSAQKVYIASLLNVPAVVNQLTEAYENETIIVICSGSSDEFCLEDFYGAGYFISELVKMNQEVTFDMTESALTAKLFFENSTTPTIDLMKETRVGNLLATFGYEDDLAFVSQKGIYSVVPQLIGENTIVK